MKSIKNLSFVFIVTSTAVLFSGCSVNQPSSPMSQGRLLSPDLSVLPESTSTALTDNSSYFSLAITEGPLEGNTLTADASYYAASGLMCRNINLEGNAGVRKTLACSDNTGVWHFVRRLF